MVDALVLGTSEETRAGSIPVLSTFYVGSSAVERRIPNPNVEGSIPSRRAMRVSYNGITLAFQTGEESSILSTRSKFNRHM